MTKKLIPLAIISILLISGCSKNPVPAENNDANTTTPATTDTNLTTYTNSQYNIEVTYPKDWTFEATVLDQTDKNSAFDIHINTPVPQSDSPCPGKYAGIEITASIDKSGIAPQPINPDFREFAKKYIVCSDPLGGLGCLGGNIEDVTINGLSGLKGADSGWDGCKGPGYALDQSTNKYIYVYTGTSADVSTEDAAKLENIVKSIKTLE